MAATAAAARAALEILPVLMLLAALAFFSYSDVSKAMDAARPWMNPVITPKEVAALDWVRQNTAERELFVTDIFGGELLMGRALREGTEGGDWAIVPNVVDRMADIDKIYDSKNSSEAWALAKKYGAKWVWVPDRQLFAGFSWKSAQEQKFHDENFFELAYDDQVQVFKVK
ncbi:MAG: hypothetical protein NTY90_03420 [Candidatus Micrarchaeota archaeon]|nr:hypothetical protein [Candidatus Micrarchaeota archaeon]